MPGCWRTHLPVLVHKPLAPAHSTKHSSAVVQIDQRYVPQLQAVLSWPHSMGIVGGRPASSLYFVGHLTDQLVFLDPHESQQVR